MSEQKPQVLPAAKPFITVAQAKATLADLIAKAAPTGGRRFGIQTSFLSTFMLSTPDDAGGEEWRIGVSIQVPRYANMVFGQLASWGAPGSRKRIDFVLKAKANAVTLTRDGEPPRAGHNYTILNGSFQGMHHLSTEMKVAKPFRDKTLRGWYGTTYDNTDFEQILNVVRSEITGESALPKH